MIDRDALKRALIDVAGLTSDQVGQAESMAASRSQPLEKAALALGLAEEALIYRAVAKAAGLPFFDPVKNFPKADVLERLPLEQIQANQALPVGFKNGALFVAIDDPVKTFVADTLGFVAGCEIRCALSAPSALKEALARALGGRATGERAGAGTRTSTVEGEDAPIIRLVHQTVEEALNARASDIHVEPFENRVRVRYRVDGVLREKASLDKALLGSLTSRLKIMASMDIAERRKPQDGRIDFRVAGREIDIRTSVLPSSHGETVVMRLLDKEKNLLSLEALGFAGEDHERFKRIIKRPNGVFLVTGPTGSGKTTTLYAALRQLNRSDTKIITAEDPVEFNLAGINQCQVKSSIGLSFARILRAMLRQAPNIILVGEIRDRETAEIAVQAALTGHLVFSTLHTNDAPSAITRLIDMGVKPFLVSSAVTAVMAQRLMRVLCKECKEPYEASDIDMRTLGLDAGSAPPTLYRGTGCTACEGSGYRGRIGIFELMQMDPTLREMTFRGESTLKIRDYAQSSAGMGTLTDDGVRKVVAGTTTVEELLRVTAAR